MPKISICTTVHKLPERLSERFLVEFLSDLMYQTFKDFEVIVADQSDTNEMEIICNVFSKVLNIKYIKNTKGLNTTADNVNLALSNATGELIKILFVDDFFMDRFGLQDTWNAFQANPDKVWLIAGWVHCNQEKTHFFGHSPTPTFIFGTSWVSGIPSTYAIRREYYIEWDDSLIYLVDGDLFDRTYWYYGLPIMVSKILHCYRYHEFSARENSYVQSLEETEREYMDAKFNNLDLELATGLRNGDIV